MRIASRAVPTLMVALLILVGLVSPASASASRQASPNDVVYYTQYRGVHKTYRGTYSGDWRRCVYVSKAKYRQSVSCSRGVTVSASISGSAGYSNGVISASVGFNVSYSTTVSSSITVTVRAGGHGWYDVGFRYSRYTIGMEQRTCIRQTGHCLPWSSPQTVTVQHHLGNTYHYFGTGAV
jgi:hypothetical protein